MVDYNKRLVEVDEVLKYLPEEYLSQIPNDIRQLIKENKDKEYVWEYDTEKPLKDQNLSRDTIAILSYLNMEYLLNEEQKQLMEKMHELNEKKKEETKAKMYTTEDLFNKNKSMDKESKTDDNTQAQALVEYKEGLFKRLINKIKNFFKKD